MTENGEQSPAKSPWTSDNTFVRSRFIVKRLKRMRSQTKSLHEDVDGLFRYPSQEPCSLPYEVNHPSTSPVARFSLPYETNQFECCGSEKNIDTRVNDLVNISMENRFRLTEEDVTFDDESIQSLSRKHSASLTTSESSMPKVTGNHEENNNCNGLLEIAPEFCNNRFELLEEIENALPKEYSLKRILLCFYSVTMHRVLMRLSRSSFLDRKRGINSGVVKTNDADKKLIEKEISRLDVELMVQKMLMEQAKKALGVSNFWKYALEGQLEAEKALLLTYVKCEAVQRLREKLSKMDVGDGWWKEESACASIKEITIAVENPAVWSAYKYIVVAVERDHVKGTQFEYVTRDSALHFTTPLHFYNLSPNFTIHLYLYGIPVKDTKSKYRSTERLSFLTHKSHKKETSASSLTITPHNFTLIGTAVVQRSHFARTKITLLTNIGNLSNAMEIQMRGDVYLNTLYAGFLDIRYESQEKCVASMWTRLWFRLTGLYLQAWPYPFQEIVETPTHLICLNKCKTLAEPEDIFNCARPNTFHMTVENAEDDEQKIQCSADSAEEVETWCHHLNKAITACRIWNS